MALFSPVYAQVNIQDYWALADVPQFQTLGGFVSFFLPKALLIAGIIMFVLVVLAGFGMIAAAGNEDAHAKEKARAYLTYAIIGLMIIFGAVWVLQIINFITSGSLNAILTP